MSRKLKDLKHLILVVAALEEEWEDPFYPTGMIKGGSSSEHRKRLSVFQPTAAKASFRGLAKRPRQLFRGRSFAKRRNYWHLAPTLCNSCKVKQAL